MSHRISLGEIMSDTTTKLVEPNTDLSPHVVQLARAIDRLPPGQYEIKLVKQDLRQQDWNFEIAKTETLSRGNLSSTKYLSE